jgi:3-oxoacyl-[acyl-carrier protein] reductase
MDLHLKDKVVVITGGATGIGFACAIGFLREGCKVAICGRSREKLQSAKMRAQALGCELLTCTADVSVVSDVENFAAYVCTHYGKIDVWINNAGMVIFKTLLEMSEAEWDQIVAVNLKSVFIGCRVASRHMEEHGGVILNAASFAAIIPSAGSGAYAATKSAILSLTRTLAAELAPSNIRVNAYVPGVIRTEMNSERIEQCESSLKGQIALNEVADADDVVPAIVFLASKAAKYITGTAIEVSGGKLCVQNPDYAWKIKVSSKKLSI